jgi:hypothetical protein
LFFEILKSGANVTILAFRNSLKTKSNENDTVINLNKKKIVLGLSARAINQLCVGLFVTTPLLRRGVFTAIPSPSSIEYISTITD